MYKIHYDEIEKLKPKLRPKQIAIQNVEMADKYCHHKLFIACAAGWFKANPGKNPKHLEKELRARKLNTHILANPISVPPNMKLIHNDKECEFECTYICKPEAEAREEVLEYWPNYDQNFKALAKSGELIENEPKKKKIEPTEPIDSMILVAENKVLVSFEEVDAMGIIKLVEQNLVDKYNKKPDHVIIAHTHEGSPIVGLFIDNLLVSNYGYKCSLDNDEIDIVDLKVPDNVPTPTCA